MEMYLYQVVMINGKMVAFEAEEVESDSDKHVFYVDGEVVGEFERRNIAGYIAAEMEYGEDYD